MERAFRKTQGFRTVAPLGLVWATHAGYNIALFSMLCGSVGQPSRNMQKVLKLRVSDKDQRSFQEAATVTGQTVSGWMRSTLLERAAEMRAKKIVA